MTQKCAVKAGLVRKDWDSEEEIKIKAMMIFVLFDVFINILPILRLVAGESWARF